MTTYVVLLPGDESAWEAATPEQQAAVFARHEEFARALAERGHKVSGGAELTHSRTTKRVSKGHEGNVVVSDDVEDLLQVCSILLDADGASGGSTIEVRAAVDHDGDGQ